MTLSHVGAVPVIAAVCKLVVSQSTQVVTPSSERWSRTVMDGVPEAAVTLMQKCIPRQLAVDHCGPCSKYAPPSCRRRRSGCFGSAPLGPA